MKKLNLFALVFALIGFVNVFAIDEYVEKKYARFIIKAEKEVERALDKRLSYNGRKLSRLDAKKIEQRAEKTKLAAIKTRNGIDLAAQAKK